MPEARWAVRQAGSSELVAAGSEHRIDQPAVPMACPVCESYVLTGDSAPSRCMVTAGCEGKPFKVAAATGDTGRKTAGAAKTVPATPSEAEPTPEATAAAAKAAPARRTVKKAVPEANPMIEHMPYDIPEPEPVAEAEPPGHPLSEEPAPSAKAPAAEPVLDLVVVADEEAPFA